MNYTNDYHLPQWEETDRILMQDFNQMCANVEKGLKENFGDASHAYKMADLARTRAANAQSTADQALSKANAAQETADNAYSPDQKPYAIGSYVGTGKEKNLMVGFRPSFIIITGKENDTADQTILLASTAVDSPCIQFPTGYVTLLVPANAASVINIKDKTYYYIAFR